MISDKTNILSYTGYLQEFKYKFITRHYNLVPTASSTIETNILTKYSNKDG